MSAEENEIIESLDLSQLVPKVYEDLLQPAVKEFGQGAVLDVAKAVNVAFSPLKLVVAGKELISEWVKVSLTKKFSSKSPDQISSPPAYVAGPVLQGLTFAFEVEELREMYKNLLAKSMEKGQENKYHVSFANIIQQLTPNEALILSKMKGLKAYDLIGKEEIESGNLLDDSIDIFYEIVSSVDKDSYEIYQNNLSRLNIIEVREVPNAEVQAAGFNFDNKVVIESEYENYEVVNKRFIEIALTPYGELFIDCCCE